MQEDSPRILNEAKSLEPTSENIEAFLRLITPFLSSYYEKGSKVHFFLKLNQRQFFFRIP